jgi:hypothetical protein
VLVRTTSTKRRLFVAERLHRGADAEELLRVVDPDTSFRAETRTSPDLNERPPSRGKHDRADDRFRARGARSLRRLNARPGPAPTRSQRGAYSRGCGNRRLGPTGCSDRTSSERSDRGLIPTASWSRLPRTAGSTRASTAASRGGTPGPTTPFRAVAGPGVDEDRGVGSLDQEIKASGLFCRRRHV